MSQVSACVDIDSDNCLIDGADESAYTPTAGDVGKSLTAAASYFDQGKHHFAQGRGLRDHVYVTQAAGREQAPHLRTGRNFTDLKRSLHMATDTNTLIDLMHCSPL